MLEISFGYTWPAAVAREKTKTRRLWKEAHARKFKKDRLCRGIDKDRRAGGGEILLLRLVADAVKQPMIDMPDSDYYAEGFAYLNEHRHMIPKCMPYDVSWAGFCNWRNSGGSMYVVAFEILEVFPSALKMLEELNRKAMEVTPQCGV